MSDKGSLRCLETAAFHFYNAAEKIALAAKDYLEAAQLDLQVAEMELEAAGEEERLHLEDQVRVCNEAVEKAQNDLEDAERRKAQAYEEYKVAKEACSSKS